MRITDIKPDPVWVGSRNQWVVKVESVAEAASFCQRLPSCTLDFLEEPIRDETPEAYAALRRWTQVPLAVGEEFASKWQYLPYIERHLTHYIRLDLCTVGGFTAATILPDAAVPNFAWLEVRVSRSENLYYGQGGVSQAEALFPIQPRLTGTRFPVPDAPGLGIELDEKQVHGQSWRFWDAPHYRRADGSVTNW